MKIFNDIIFNLGTIVAFGIIPSFVGINIQNRFLKLLLYGFLFGSGAVIGMMHPVELQIGLFFDGRSVLISLSGLLFGPIPAVISASMAIALRLYQGGLAAITGSLVIVSSAILGILFNNFHKIKEPDFSVWFLLFFGLIVHIVMLLLMFTLPGGKAIPTLKQIGIPVIIIYPLATILIGKILSLIFTRQKTTKALCESEEKYRTLVNNANEVIIVVQGGYIKFLNQRIVDLMGYTQNELMSKPFPTFLHPEDREMVIENHKKRLNGMTTQPRYSFRVINSIGDTRWVEIATTLIEWQSKPATLNFLTDITERKNAEEQLINSRNLLQRIINLLPIRVFWKDKNLKFLGCNEIFAKDAGKNKVEDLIGQDDYQMNWKEQAELYRADDRAVMETNIPKLNFEEPQTTPEGDIIWLKTSKVPLTDFSENTIGILGVYEDITDQKKVEEALWKLNEELETRVWQRTIELENSNKDLEAFSNSISHDLRAPLRAIDGFSQMLKNQFQTEIGFEGSKMVDMIVENTSYMNRLIKGMMAISKISGGEIKKIFIKMNRMVDTVYKEIVNEDDKERISLTVEPLEVGYGDPTLLKQVWVNYLENAVKFSRKKEHPMISICSFIEDQEIVYSVQDNGVGFNPQYQKKLFQMFQRLHSSQEFEGTGIGLAIVERIIRRHGGKVWAEGEEGVGATFYFSLPILE